MLARTLSMRLPAASSTLRIEVLGCLVTTGIMSSIAASIPAVAAWQRASTSLVAAVIGDAVDHRLRPRVHVLEAHVGEAGDVLQAFGRQRQRERLAQVGAAGGRQRIEDAVGMGLELPAPGIAHRARRHRRKHRRAFRHVRVAVLAHHVVAHQRVHQAGRLVRGEHVDAFLLAEKMSSRRVNTVEPSCGTNAIGASRAHPRQIRIGIGPERRHVDVEMRGVGHGVSVASGRLWRDHPLGTPAAQVRSWSCVSPCAHRATLHNQLSPPANAGGPVRRGLSLPSLAPRNTGSPGRGRAMRGVNVASPVRRLALHTAR